MGAENEKPAAPWYRAPWVRWAGAVVLPTALAVVCPMLPWPAAQVACRAAGHVVTEVAKRSSEVQAAPPEVVVPGGVCPEGKVQAVPHFCKCVNGQWVDYLDGGTCGG